MATIGICVASVGSVTMLASCYWLKRSHAEAQYYEALTKRLTAMSHPNRFETRLVKGRQSIRPHPLHPLNDSIPWSWTTCDSIAIACQVNSFLLTLTIVDNREIAALIFYQVQ